MDYRPNQSAVAPHLVALSRWRMLQFQAQQARLSAKQVRVPLWALAFQFVGLVLFIGGVVVALWSIGVH